MRTACAGEFRALCGQVERRLGKKMSTSDLKSLFSLYDHLALPVEVILMLVAWCVEEMERKYGPGRRPFLSQIKKEGFIWARRGIDTMEAAQAMRGKTVELYREDIDDEVIFAAELIGVEVYAEGENIGKIVDVLDYPGNSVYVVKGKYEYMIPAVKQFILSTDMEKNEMQVKLIEGMRSDEN